MFSKSLISATSALALVAAPVLAQANPAPAPAIEAIDDGAEMVGGSRFIIPLIAVIAVALLILAATNDDDDDLPTSP